MREVRLGTVPAVFALAVCVAEYAFSGQVAAGFEGMEIVDAPMNMAAVAAHAADSAGCSAVIADTGAVAMTCEDLADVVAGIAAATVDKLLLDPMAVLIDTGPATHIPVVVVVAKVEDRSLAC